MQKTTTRKLINAPVMIRAGVVALCMGVAPMALAEPSGVSPLTGGNYLVASFDRAPSSFHGDEVGGYGPSRAVPEPATWGTFGFGLAMIGFGVLARRRRVGASDR